MLSFPRLGMNFYPSRCLATPYLKYTANTPSMRNSYRLSDSDYWHQLPMRIGTVQSSKPRGCGGLSRAHVASLRLLHWATQFSAH